MNKPTQLLLIGTAGFALACASASADTFLRDSFITAATSEPTNGIYQVDGALSGATGGNRSLVGGSTVGYSNAVAGDYWTASSTGLPIVTGVGVPSNSVAASGGSISYRGNATVNNRMVYREIDAYTGPTSTYFSATLSTNFLDDNATSLVAFTNLSSTLTGDRILDNGVSGAYNGVAMGFLGDGAGGMDLILRYRTSTASVYADQVLLAGITLNTSYTVMGRINWESGPGVDRDGFTVWVNPASVTEPLESEGISLVGFLGTSTNINSVYLLQKNFGTGVAESVFMDEIRLGSTWADLTPIPEPSTYALLIGAATAFFVFVRRRARA